MVDWSQECGGNFECIIESQTELHAVTDLALSLSTVNRTVFGYERR